MMVLNSVFRGCHLFRDPHRAIVRLSIFLAISIFVLFVTHQSWTPSWFGGDWRPFRAGLLTEADLQNITQTASYFTDHAIRAPYKQQFWEVGQRSRQLSQWLSLVDRLEPRSRLHRELLATTETTAQQLFPFLRNPPQNPKSESPLTDLRNSYKRGSRGIVMSVGGGDQAVRFAGHLISSLRQILDCRLPIQIVYAGEEDLPQAHRDLITAFPGATDIEFLDVLTIFNDSTLKLREGGWAIKAFAVLASTFEQTILVDADAVFLQKPEILFDQQAYINKGAYLFHDRLLWQHAFGERHDWWKDQIKEPSPEMLKSLVWTEDYAEECDSGVVVVDKSRVDVLVGLLHVAWQNTYDVREEVTYRLTHGDKESWWLGLELAGSTYEFESHYGSMIGWADTPMESNVTKVCSFVIAHVDQDERLIWYNGSLLKNKRVDPEGYDVPEYWMMDGTWQKGATREDMSCMTESRAIKLTDDEEQVLSASVNVAKEVDLVIKGNKEGAK